MKADEYRKIAEHPLRAVFRGMVGPSDELPTRSDLRAMIAEAVPGDELEPVREALFKKAVSLAEEAKDRERWWDLRYAADHFTLEVVQKLEAQERIVEPSPPDTFEAFEAGEVARAASDDPLNARARIDSLFQSPEDRVRELERQLKERA